MQSYSLHLVSCRSSLAGGDRSRRIHRPSLLLSNQGKSSFHKALTRAGCLLESRIRYYQSNNTLGVLYRKVDEAKFFDEMKNEFQDARSSLRGESLMEKLERYLDRETRGLEWKHHREFAELVRE